MLVPLVALGRVNFNLWPHILVTALSLTAGHWYSYRYLENRKRWVQGLMFGLIHVAGGWLFVGLFIGATIPQAQFAIFTQAITSFDLRYRRSLFNTLLHSLAILYVVASFSRTLELALYLLLFMGLVMLAFMAADWSDGLAAANIYPVAETQRHQKAETSDGTSLNALSRSYPSLLIFAALFSVTTLSAIVVVFLFTPRFANKPLVPPFTINAPLRGGIKSEIVNPGIPLVQVNGWSNERSDYFYGFDTELDLRYRGGLSDEIVMYVRSPSRSYWRSHSYDFYSGTSWRQSSQKLIEIERRCTIRTRLTPPLGSPIDLTETAYHQRPRPQEIVQSFTIVKQQPNLIFTAYRPAEIFLLTADIWRDIGDGLRLPQALAPGLTYSVVSHRPEFEPLALRQDNGPYPAEISQRYLQLPDNISARVRQLAETLTAAERNRYDKVTALNEHLRATYPYNFFPPPHPPGAEVVDTFLFEDQEGICEQYVTALVIMARTLGIPARLTAGYGAGDYNPVTGYYEVRHSHAHSWAEIYFPQQGWVPFDPTPGWSPNPYPTPAQQWFLSNDFVWEGLSAASVPLGAAVSRGLQGLAAMSVYLIGLTLVVITVSLGGLLYRFWPRFAAAYRHRRQQSSLPANQPTRRAVLRLYRQGIRLLTPRQRSAGETLTEYAQQVGDSPALKQLTQAAEIAAYRPEPPTEQTVAQAQAAVESLNQATQ